jgi:hypothetical protein
MSISGCKEIIRAVAQLHISDGYKSHLFYISVQILEKERNAVV